MFSGLRKLADMLVGTPLYPGPAGGTLRVPVLPLAKESPPTSQGVRSAPEGEPQVE